MKKYPEAYEAVRAAIQRDVAEKGFYALDRTELCIKVTYGYQVRAINRGLMSEKDVVRAFAP